MSFLCTDFMVDNFRYMLSDLSDMPFTAQSARCAAQHLSMRGAGGYATQAAGMLSARLHEAARWNKRLPINVRRG